VRPLLDRLAKYVAATTDGALMRDVVTRLALGKAGSTIAATVRDRNDRVRQVTLAYFAPPPLMPPPATDRDMISLLSKDIGYVDLTRLRDVQVNAMFEQLRETKAIVFDMRGYPSGRDAAMIAARLTAKRGIPIARFDTPLVMTPSSLLGGSRYSAHTSVLSTLPETDKWRYEGKTVMLINERTQSASEYYAQMFEVANGTKFVGSRTAGASGNITFGHVPGGILMRFSGMAARTRMDDNCNVSAYARMLSCTQRLQASGPGKTRCWRERWSTFGMGDDWLRRTGDAVRWRMCSTSANTPTQGMPLTFGRAGYFALDDTSVGFRPRRWTGRSFPPR
jgi:hypothetical protein